MPIDFPNSPSNDDKFLNTNGALYTYDLPDDSWTAYEVPGTVPTEPTPSQISSSPAFESGTGVEGDPWIITTTTVATADASALSTQIITITGAEPLDSVNFYSASTPAGSVSKFTQPLWIIDAEGSWTGQLLYNDNLGIDTTTNTTYTAVIRLGSSVYFRWIVNQQV